ncbi:MAG: ABC transporter substrate-binding protein [Gammaproteobacteria bacterium]|nr:MAG: ABC transporter substrate-binding protein [Gammaproteobacteria bacterium]
MAIALSLTACTKPPDDVIHFGLASHPANLDPRYATDATSARINRLLYQRLVDFDEYTRPVPALATWDVLTPHHYRFTLKSGRNTFHDGQPLTAGDVAATYRFILDPANASPHRSALQLIERIEVIDRDTLDFHIERPDPLFPGYLVIGIVPAAAIADAHPLQQEPLGSGTFRFHTWPEPGRLQLMRQSDGQVVEFLRVGNPTVRVLKLLRGEIDLLQNDLSAEMLNYLGQQEDISVGYRPGSNFSYLGFNLQDPQTGRLEIRKAVAHAINRQAIIDHLLGGNARNAAALLPPTHWAGNPALVPVEHDLVRARQLLAQAGFSRDDPLKLQYKTSTDPLRIRIATVIQQQLADIGIEMTLSSYDWGTFYGDIKAGRFQMYSLAWVGIKTPDIFRYAFHSRSLPPEGANRGRLADARVDALIEAAENARTLEQQADNYRAVQARLLEQLPYVPLWYENHFVAARNTVTGYRLASDGNYDGLRFIKRVQ